MKASIQKVFDCPMKFISALIGEKFKVFKKLFQMFIVWCVINEKVISQYFKL